ncbi:hypothetical protein [Bradyrhizobium sp.]|uniref:hypothetical protein n=1 Tax=Bradyrhizobium sp. TaxID=376 RepID=UPI00262F9C16|nr:hypothetical protein [Bradyrhizobium sp.]
MARLVHLCRSRACCGSCLIDSDLGKVCVITLCAGRAMKRWLKLVDRIEAYARDEGCGRVHIFGRKGWLRVLEGYEARHVVMDKLLVSVAMLTMFFFCSIRFEVV